MTSTASTAGLTYLAQAMSDTATCDDATTMLSLLEAEGLADTPISDIDEDLWYALAGIAEGTQ